MPYVDFDSLVINRKNIDYDELKNLMLHFRSYGVSNFIIAYDVDPDNEFIATIIHNIRNLKNNIRRVKPYGCTVSVAASIVYRSDTIYDDRIKRLLFRRSNKIFLRLPDRREFREDDFHKSTNHLLYKLKYVPIFTRFEDVMDTYPTHISNKLFKTRRAAFCIDVNHLSKQIGTVHIFSAMNGTHEILLLPSISGDLKDYKPPELFFSDIKKRYDRGIYLKFCAFMNSSIRKIFPSN